MAGLYVTDRQSHGATVVSNRFVDDYMAEANGEFVKVYLLLLRQMTLGGELSVAGMADRLNNTEADVLRALKYWEKTGLIRLEYDRAGTLAGILLLDGEKAMQAPGQENRRGIDRGQTTEHRAGTMDGQAETGAAEQEAAAKSVFDGNGPTKEQMQALTKDADFTQLVYMAGRYTGKNLTARDCDVLGNLYGNRSYERQSFWNICWNTVFPTDIGACVILRQLPSNWKERGIRTVEQAQGGDRHGWKEYICRVKGLWSWRGRNPAAGERKTDRPVVSGVRISGGGGAGGM